MTRQLFLLNFIIIFHTTVISPMYKPAHLLRIQTTKALLITHVRNFQHHLTYTTNQGIIIAEHWDGSETHTYPDGKIINKFPQKSKNQTTPERDKVYLTERIKKLKEYLNRFF